MVITYAFAKRWLSTRAWETGFSLTIATSSGRSSWYICTMSSSEMFFLYDISARKAVSDILPWASMPIS